MLNYIAAQFAGWLISTGSAGSRPVPPASPEAVTDAIARTPEILPSARLPVVYTVPPNFELHAGIFIAIIATVAITFLLYRTTFGFSLRMAGYSPSAAKYAGVNVKRVTILTMLIAGCLAGLAGGIQTLGVNHGYEANQSLGWASMASRWPSWRATIRSASTSRRCCSARWMPGRRAWRSTPMSPKS